MEREDAKGKKIRVSVLDSSLIHTQLLTDALRRDHMLQVESSDSSKGLIASALEHPFDVFLISSNLDEQPRRGFEVLRELRATRSDIRAVLLLDSSKPEIILDAWVRGAVYAGDVFALVGDFARLAGRGGGGFSCGCRRSGS